MAGMGAPVIAVVLMEYLAATPAGSVAGPVTIRRKCPAAIRFNSSLCHQ